MKILDCCKIPKGKIVVLGAKYDSAFIKFLCAELKEKGSIEISDNVFNNSNADYSLILLDEKCNKVFSAHDSFPESTFRVGLVDVGVFEKKVSEVIYKTEIFCQIADTNENQLVYPYMLSRVIKDNEKYDFMIVDGVNTVSKRFLARELAKYLSMSVCIGSVIDGEIELLRKDD